MIEMTLSSRHRIRNSSPGGLRPEITGGWALTRVVFYDLIVLMIVGFIFKSGRWAFIRINTVPKENSNITYAKFYKYSASSDYKTVSVL